MWALSTCGVVSARPRYHHGHLREALVAAGVEMAREGGPDAVVLREASRRAGVSHNAAYRHFADREEFLAAVGERGMRELALLMEALIDEAGGRGSRAAVARRRLRATGRGYVRFAASQPGLFRTAFAAAHAFPGVGEDYGAGDSGLTPFGLLNAQLDALAEAGAMPSRRRPGAEVTAWSAVHGFSMLMLDGPLGQAGEAERDAALEGLLDTVERGLTAARR